MKRNASKVQLNFIEVIEASSISQTKNRIFNKFKDKQVSLN